MEFLLGDLIFGFVGWLYMFTKYRDITQMRIVLKEKYENHYSSVGREILSKTVLLIFVLAIITFIIITLGISIF